MLYIKSQQRKNKMWKNVPGTFFPRVNLYLVQNFPKLEKNIDFYVNL